MIWHVREFDSVRTQEKDLVGNMMRMSRILDETLRADCIKTIPLTATNLGD